MKKKIAVLGLSVALAVSMVGCGKKSDDTTTETTTATTEKATPVDATTEEATEEQVVQCELEDGTYTAEFNTDSSMFHVNDSKEGLGILTVKDGQMTIHVALTSKNIVNLYYGLAEDAQKEGAKLLQPTPEEVTYSDGLTEEVNSFDIPVPYLDDEFDVALIGKKQVWYDHKVSVSNPVKIEENVGNIELANGEYTIEVTLNGGSGKASVSSPTSLIVDDNGTHVIIVMSSEHYDYMIVDGEKYLPVNESGNSTFDIPVITFDNMPIIADTTAMSEPHEIEYTLDFDVDTITPVGTN